MRKPVSTHMDAQAGPTVVALAHGRELELEADRGDGAARLVVRSPGGELELSITIGPDGPKLTVRAVDIELVAERKLSMRCEDLDVQARGSAKILAGGGLTISGEDVHVNAPQGEIALRANDDVDVRGARIRLNCEDPPMPVSWEELERRLSMPKEGG